MFGLFVVSLVALAVIGLVRSQQDIDAINKQVMRIGTEMSHLEKSVTEKERQGKK